MSETRAPMRSNAVLLRLTFCLTDADISSLSMRGGDEECCRDAPAALSDHHRRANGWLRHVRQVGGAIA